MSKYEHIQNWDDWVVHPVYTNYAFSKDGKVMNLRTNITRNQFQITNGSLNNGYLIIDFVHNGKRVCKRIHRLVMEAFFGEINNNFVINHKDFNRSNNSLDNLEVVTQRENTIHASGKIKRHKGQDNYQSILSDKEEWEIVLKYIPRKRSQYKLADEYNVSQATIRRVLNQKNIRNYE